MITTSIEYRIPFADTDQMGVVYYANYLIYFEMAREELMRAIQLPYSVLEKEGFALPVLEAHCNYHKPAHFEDILTISATLVEVNRLKLKVACEVKRGDEILADGYTFHAFINRNGKLIRPPELFLSRIAEISAITDTRSSKS